MIIIVLESTEPTPLNDTTALSTTTDDHATSSFGLQISTNGGIPTSDETTSIDGTMFTDGTTSTASPDRTTFMDGTAVPLSTTPTVTTSDGEIITKLDHLFA